MSLRQKLGWRLMGIPWLTDQSLERGFERNNWHARIYWFGSRLFNGKS